MASSPAPYNLNPLPSACADRAPLNQLLLRQHQLSFTPDNGQRVIENKREMQERSISITGASSGIGAALARMLAGPGRALALTGRNRARLEAVAEDCRRRGAVCRAAVVEARDPAAFSRFIASFDREFCLDCAILNAGVLDGRRVGESLESARVARNVLEVNLSSSIAAVHQTLPLMMARRTGRIVLVASLAAFIPLPDAPAYSAAKAGMLAFGTALGEAVRNSGVRVSVICPGYVATGMTAHHRGDRPGEITAERAAEVIWRSLLNDCDIFGFPPLPYWLVRLSMLMPEFVRRVGQKSERFYVEPKPQKQT